MWKKKKNGATFINPTSQHVGIAFGFKRIPLWHGNIIIFGHTWPIFPLAWTARQKMACMVSFMGLKEFLGSPDQPRGALQSWKSN